MSSRHGHWLAALRRRRRGVLLALLPAMLLWTASGSACLAMLAAATPAVAAERPADAHAAHAGHASAHHHAEHAAPVHDLPPAPTATHDCPHCPPHTGTAAAHETCADASAAQAQRPAQDVGTALAALPVVAGIVVARAPPPSSLDPRGTDPPPPHVPLNLRHCVLLI